jgi:competence protein ComGC
LAAPNDTRGFGVVDWLLGVAVLGLALVVFFPYTVGDKQDRSILICVKNLRELDTAMRLWQLDKQKDTLSAVTLEEIIPYLKEGNPLMCPSEGQYIVTGLTNPPSCTIPGHALVNE